MGDFKKWGRGILVMGDDFEMCECLGGVKGKGGGGEVIPLYGLFNFFGQTVAILGGYLCAIVPKKYKILYIFANIYTKMYMQNTCIW